MKDITRRLRILRAGAGLTQRDLSRLTGMSVSRYWEIENGYRDPEAGDLRRIARAVKAHIEDIVPSQGAVAS